MARYYKEEVDFELRQAEAKLARLRKQKTELEAAIPTVMVMEELPSPRPAYLLKRGRYDMPDTSRKLDPGVPGCLGTLPSSAPRNRLALAQWLASPANPLTARVAVNRLWQQHFGTGLVKTTENFGLQSEPPSHPELLDWLAAEFIRTGWDVKAMHRLIVTSATYRQVFEGACLLDPARSREPAAGTRAAVSPAGRAGSRQRPGHCRTALDQGRRPVRQALPAGRPLGRAGRRRRGRRRTFRTRGRSFTAAASTSTASGRFRIPRMATFDAPSREICQVKRARTNTPLQALELLNDVTYVEAASHLAQLMLAEGGSSPRDRVRLRLPPRDRAITKSGGTSDPAARPGSLSAVVPGPSGVGVRVDRPGAAGPLPTRTGPDRAGRLHRDRQRDLEPGRDDHAASERGRCHRCIREVSRGSTESGQELNRRHFLAGSGLGLGAIALVACSGGTRGRPISPGRCRRARAACRACRISRPGPSA